MKILLNLFLSYLVFIYIVRPFFAGLLGETAVFRSSEKSPQQPPAKTDYTEYEEVT